ncbi:MAG: protein BatD, partial [Gemmatimonadetes bacterium]|nr:protein BatD [Gemmatimonadota bacterium]
FSTYLGSGSSTSMQIINDRTTVSLTLQYRYQALQEGTFEIPGFAVPVEGDSYPTEALTLTVSAQPPPDPQQAPEASDPTVISAEDLFVLAESSRRRIREGEPFIVEYRLFTRVNVTSYGFTSLPELEGFWVEELPLPEQLEVEQVVRDGQQYTTAVIRRVALVPTGPGERTLDPLGIEAQVRVQRRTRMLDPFESIFDLDRSSLFGTVVPATVVSNPIRLQVEALPPGRPEPFSGIVGALELAATLTPDSVDADEAFTLTVTATGRGNLRAIPEPMLELPEDFEAYPPEVSESIRRAGPGLGGSKTWEYVLIPRAPGNRSVPPVTFGYFDTETNTYRTASSGAKEILVSGEASEGVSALVRGGVASLREDIRFIHLGSGRLTRTNSSPFSGFGFWAILLLPMAAVLGATSFRFHQDRLEGDPAYARRRRAGRVAHARLSEARRMAKREDPRAFYAEVARALRGFIADKLDLAEAGMQERDLSEGLKQGGVSDAVVQDVLDCLSHCDLQRFAPTTPGSVEEDRFLKKVAGVMTELNRKMGR